MLSVIQQRGKPYGILVRRMRPPMVGDPAEVMASIVGSVLPGFGGNNDTSMGAAVLVYQIFPDGRETLIRNARLAGVNEASFKDIIAVSTKQTVYNTPFIDTKSSVLSVVSGGSVAIGPPPLISVVVPDILLEDVNVTFPSTQVAIPPLSGRPEL